MIELTQPTLTGFGGCSGFTLTDNTNYDQLDSDPTFKFNQFNAGFRFINIIYPDGTNKIFNSFPQFFPVSNITPLNTIINSDSDNWIFNTYELGGYTVQIVSIPLINQNVSPTNYLIGDLTYGYGIGTVCVAIVNNPTNNLQDITQWAPVYILPNFKPILVSEYNVGGTSFNFPTDYITQVTYTQSCYIDSLTCVLENLNGAFCCGCCDDLFKNKTSVTTIRATLLVMELELLQQQALQESTYSEILGSVNTYNTNSLSLSQTIAPSNTFSTFYYTTVVAPFTPNDSYINKVCTYSAALYRLCNCGCKSEPCLPCDNDSTNTTTYTLTPLDISTALTNIFNNDLLLNLYKQVNYGQKIDCMTRKEFLMFGVSNVVANEAIAINVNNYNCLNSVLDFTNIEQSSNDIINNAGGIIINDQGNILIYNQG